MKDLRWKHVCVWVIINKDGSLSEINQTTLNGYTQIEIENNILIFPRETIDNAPTAFTVNWTPVHWISWVFVAPDMLTCKTTVTFGSSVWFPPCILIKSTTNNLARVSTPIPIPAWLNIWKKITIPWLYSNRSSNWHTIKVWILHSDWTITYMAQSTPLETYTTQLVMSSSSARATSSTTYNRWNETCLDTHVVYEVHQT
mgnify:CR=1 FL=1